MKPRNRFIITAISFLLLAPASFAGNTWDGGGGNGNWSSAANWNGDTNPNYASLLTFAGATNLITTNDSATGTVAGMTFSSGAGAFTLNGSSVTLGGNITNNSTSTQSVNLPLVLDANRTIATTSGNVILGGPISGAFNLIKTQGNTLILNSAGSSFGLLQINAGTVRLGVNDASPTNAGVTFAVGASGNGFLDLNGKTQTLGAAVTIGGSVTTGTVTINDSAGGGVLKLGGNVVQNATSSNIVNISAALDLNGANRNFALSNSSGVVTVSGTVSNSIGTAGIGKTGSTGELILSGANTFNGNTTVSAGLLTLGNSLALQNSTLDTTNIIASSSATTGLKTTVTTLTLGGLSGNKNLATLFDASNGYGGVTALTLNPSNGADVTYTGVIANGASGMTLTKTGAGKQTLSGVSTYSGGTTVSNGTLLVNNNTGSGTGSGAVDVSNGATLGGTGSISGAVNVSGVLSPGASIESLGTGTLTLNNGSSFKYEMNTDTVGADLLHVTGNLNIGANVTLDLTDLASLSEVLAVDTKFTLLSYTGTWNNGTFNGYADESTFLFGNNQWRINYNDLTGGDNFTADQSGASGFVTLTVIPEPSSSGLVGLGGLGALMARRRKRN